MKNKHKVELHEREEVELNRFILPLFFIVFSIALEIQQFDLLGFSETNNGQLIPLNFLFNLGAILIIAGVIFWARKTKAMISIKYNRKIRRNTLMS